MQLIMSSEARGGCPALAGQATSDKSSYRMWRADRLPAKVKPFGSSQDKLPEFPKANEDSPGHTYSLRIGLLLFIKLRK